MIQGAWGGDNIRSFQAAPNLMWLRWTSGATGAVTTIDPTKRYGFAKVGASVAPVVRTGTGLFTLNLEGQWNDLLDVEADIQQASDSAAGACGIRRLAFSLSAKTVNIKTVNAAGAATDPTTGDIITVRLEMQANQNT